MPTSGVNLEYDEAVEQVVDVEQKLDQYLKEQRRKLRCQVRSFAT